MSKQTRTTKDDAHLCACGCSEKAGRVFKQGHDARAHSLLLKVERGELKASDIPQSLRTADLKGFALGRLLRKVTR